MSTKKNPCKKSRHPMVKKGDIPTNRHTFISCGKIEKKILKYMLSLKGSRFNIRAFHNDFNVPRGTVYDSLKSLINKGLVVKEHYGSHNITKAGTHYLESVGTHRRVCRNAPDVSYVRDHKFTFEIPVLKFPKDWGVGTVALLNKDYIQTNLHMFSKNNPILHANFPDDVDVVFSTRKVIIKPKNIYENDHTGASSKAITKAYEIIKLLLDADFKFTNNKGVLSLIQKEGHFAEVNTLLSEFFEKHAKGFKVDDEKGKALFWIDHSDGHREDETADETARDRLNKAMYDIMDNELPKFSEVAEDLENLKNITSDLVKLQLMNSQMMVAKNEYHDKFDYVG